MNNIKEKKKDSNKRKAATCENASTAKKDKPSTEEICLHGFERGLPAEAVIGATVKDDELVHLVKWEGTDEADLVPARITNVRCPELVIKFYEERVNWGVPSTVSD